MPGPLARIPIGTKLPLAAAVLILLVGGALSTAAYFTMRRTLMDRATERLTALSTQFTETFRTNVAQAKVRASAAAGLPAVAAYLRSPGSAREPDALVAMEYVGPQPELDLATELRGPDGRVLLSSSAGGVAPRAPMPSLGERDSTGILRTFPSLAGSDSAAVGKLRQDGDSILYPVVARVPGKLGYYVNWRRVSTTPQARDQIAGLLGSDAAFYVGNADGSAWSDLGRPGAAPPVEPGALQGIVRYARSDDRGDVLASAMPIPGSPWVYTIEMPIRAILAPARSFLTTLAGIAIACITLGFIAAWLASRRITGPLRHLTTAADAIAAGDVSRRVHLRRSDELGRLGASFDAMAAQVEDSQRALAATVAERTRELRDTQETLIRREKLALIGHLASGVGHELRNPLGVMTNAIYYLEAIIPDPPTEVREYLGILRNQVGLSAKIVNDLLDLTRTTVAHRQSVQVRSVTQLQLERIALNGVRLEQDLPDSLPPVEVDPVHAGQVVLNLLTNAMQAMGEAGGTLTLRGRVATDGFVHLEVSDTGPGVAREHLGKIFEPLFTTKARGIGLGLAVSKSLAQANGGDLTVASEPGRGATFIFQLPIASAAT